MGKPKNSLFQYLGSLRLSIPLLFLIAAMAVAGSLIPQNLTGEAYRKLFSPFVFQVLDRLQLFDVFHSVWFISLLALLALNLILCSWQRFPTVWKTAQSRSAPQPVKTSQRVFHQEFQPPTQSEDDVIAHLKKTLKHNFAQARNTGKNENPHLFAQKGAWSRLAVFFVHLSIILILAGALIGAVWGFKAFVAIPEGGNATQVRLNRSGEIIPLGFEIRCDKFNLAYYENSCQPKEFKSLVSIIDNGKITVDHQPIIVNAPLTYKGTRFYQSSYGPVGNPTVGIRVRNRNTREETTHLFTSSEAAPLPDGGSFRVVRFSSCFQDMGPVAIIEIDPGRGEPFKLPVFSNAPDVGEAHNHGPLSFSLSHFEQPWYTGLQVNRDPGLWWVWSGFILMPAGLLMAFGFSHRRIWVSVYQSDNLTKISVWGDCQRNPVAFERFFRHLCTVLESDLSPAKEEET